MSISCVDRSISDAEKLFGLCYKKPIHFEVRIVHDRICHKLFFELQKKVTEIFRRCAVDLYVTFTLYYRYICATLILHLHHPEL